MRKIKDHQIHNAGIVCDTKEEWEAILDLLQQEGIPTHCKKEFWGVNPVQGTNTIRTSGEGWTINDKGSWTITYPASEFLGDSYPIF